MIRLSDCDKCKFYTGLNQETKQMTCKAFPTGIPVKYVFGDVNVHEINECANGFKYTEKKSPAPGEAQGREVK